MKYLFGVIIGLLINTPVLAQDIITLTQTPCQFIEPERGDLGFTASQKADCVAINKTTTKERLSKADVMHVKQGDFIFRVSNKSVPYDLGFWIRDIDYDWRNPLHKLTKLSVSGGGLKPGTTKDYKVSLEPGEYLYSCPLNTTPDYHLIVTQ